ncbi:MAG: carcinine hydrolase/isopenicillin-N N-acyltransferase family protein [Planctomycetota bacterium]
MKAVKTKRHKYLKKVLIALLLLAAVGLVVLSALLYCPVRTMASLEKVDDFPLYVMRYRGTYFFDLFAEEGIEWWPYRKMYEKVNPDACTSLAALNPDGDAVFGRNFDWRHRASLLLFTDPPNGYASVSMVDLYYLGLEGMQEIPWDKRFILLAAPYASIDGMNECGVAIAQNAVPLRQTPKDPNKPTLLNSQIVRLVLDNARDVDEALALIQQYNVDFEGACVHFHIADATGKSAIVEYVDGGVAIVRDDKLWQVSTNFLLSEAQQPDCWRYNKATESLGEAQGNISADEAMVLLQDTSQGSTVWSIVYNLSTGQIRLAMGKDYDQVHTFKLKMKSQQRIIVGSLKKTMPVGATWLPDVTRARIATGSVFTIGLKRRLGK